MTQTHSPLYTAFWGSVIVACGVALTGCVYRITIQQGNVLEPDAVEQVEIGMSQSAVQFLLGTPAVADPFHRSRWDYPYYLRVGRSKQVERSWLAVYFEDGRVSRIERNLTLNPDS